MTFSIIFAQYLAITFNLTIPFVNMTDRFGNITISSEKSKNDTTRKPSRRPQRKPPSKRNTKTNPANRKAVLFVLLVLLLAATYCFTGYYFIPHYLQQKLTTTLQEKFSLQTKLSSITFNPFTFMVSLNDLSLLDPASNSSSKDIVHIPKITAKLAPFELIRNDYVLKTLNIQQPRVLITRFRENTYNFSEYLTHNSSQPAEDFLDFARLPFFYSLNNITVENGEIVFNDKPSGKVHTIRNLALGIPSLSNFDYQTDLFVSSHFSADIDGIPLEIVKEKNETGEKSANTFVLNLNDADLPAYVNYLPFTLPATINNGKLNGKLKLSFSTVKQEAKQFTISFQLDIDEMSATTNDRSLAASALSCKLLGTYSPLTKNLFLDNVYINKPHFRLTDNFSHATLDTFLFHDDNNGSKNKTLSINRLFLDGGKLDFSNPEKNKRNNWSNIQLTLKDYQTQNDANPSVPGTLQVSASQKDNGTELLWNGKITHTSLIAGDISIQKFSPESFSRTFLPDNFQIHGSTGSLKGQFSLSTRQQEKADRQIIYSLNNTTVEIQNPSFDHLNHSTIRAESVKFTNFEYGRLSQSYGDMQLTNALMDLSVQELPNLFTPLLVSRASLLKSFTTNGMLTLNDIKHKTQYIFKDISIKAVDHDKKKGLQRLDFQGVTSDGGKFTARGTGQFTPLKLSVSIDFKDIRLQKLLPLFTTNTIVSDSDATVSGKGQYTYPQSGYFGSLTVNNTSISMDNQTKFQAEKIEIPQLVFKSTPFYLKANIIKCSTSTIYWNQNSQSATPQKSFSTFLNHLLPVKNFPENISKNKKPFYDFTKVLIENGSLVTISENNLKTRYSIAKGEMKNLRFPSKGKEATFNIKASQDNTLLNLAGSGDFFSIPSNGRATLTFSNLDGENFKNQTIETGLFAKQSKIDGTIDCEWFNDETQNDISLTIKNMLPLAPDSISALTLALLYERNPEFTLELEHRTAPDLPDLSLSEAIIGNFKKNLIKAEISPFLLTPEFSDLTGKNHLVFGHGKTALTGETQETLLRISELLKAHPFLTLTLTSHTSKEDVFELQKQLEQKELERITLENERRYEQWQIENARASKKREELQENSLSSDGVIEEDLKLPEIKPFQPLRPSPVKVSKDEISKLEINRIQTVKSFLVNDLTVAFDQVKEGGANQDSKLNGITLNFSTRFKPGRK